MGLQSKRFRVGHHDGRNLLRACLSVLTLLAALTLRTNAGELPSSFAHLDEIRFGVLAVDLEPGGGTDDSAGINAEILLQRFGEPSTYPILDVLFRPRVHVGVTVGFQANSVNQGYAGLTWDYALDPVFIETSFGGAIHDGATDAANTDSYGCTLEFRESASLGVNVTDHLRLIATVDHISNAGLCDENQGLTNAGVRLGYRW